jgi:hypothetical protein
MFSEGVATSAEFSCGHSSAAFSSHGSCEIGLFVMRTTFVLWLPSAMVLALELTSEVTRESVKSERDLYIRHDIDRVTC